MDSPYARELHDGALSEEIRLLGDLVLAASVVTRHLTRDEVDQILQAHRLPTDRFTPPTAHTTGRLT